MRTNPFFDSLVFLMGGTDDQKALGLFNYVILALFIALLVGSFWIAFTNWRDDPAQRTLGNVATWISRLLVGCMWFQGSLWKLPLPVAGGFQHWTEMIQEHAAFEFHRNIAENIFLPWISVVDPLVFLTEMTFAISLMLGVGVRVVSIFAALFALHLWLGLYTEESEWPWNYMFLAIVHVMFWAYAAGRSLGVDALARRNAMSGGSRSVLAQVA